MSSTLHALSASSAASGTLIAARWYDYIPIAIYFAFVIGVGSSPVLSGHGRWLPHLGAVPAGLGDRYRLVSANLGAVEIMGMVRQRRRVRHADLPLLLDRRVQP